MSISVSLVEDNQELCRILTDSISQAEGFRCISQCSSAASALIRLPRDQPDVVLMDINLSGQSGIDCVRQLKPAMPNTQFLMLTVFEDGDHIFDALTAGASGYLLKRTSNQELLNAIREVHEGGSPMTSDIARKVVLWFQKRAVASPRDLDGLSSRELEILRLLARGCAYKEIADLLAISIGTINTHIRRVYQKLHVHSRCAAVALFSPFPSEPQTPSPARK